MAYLRLVQGVTRPTSYPVSAGATLERGKIVFKLTDGTVSNVAENGCTIAGFCDDDKATSLYDKLIGSFIGTGTTGNGGNLTGSISTGILIWKDDIAATTLSNFPGWSVEYREVGASTWLTGNSANWTVALDASTGVISITASGLTANKSYEIKLNLAYEVKHGLPGAITASDMFSNDSTVASGLATVYFLEGIYETDQYDPFQAYGINDPVYVTNKGILTSKSADGVTDGTSAIVVGYVDKAPQATYTAETRVVSGHISPKPEALRIRFVAPTQKVSIV